MDELPIGRRVAHWRGRRKMSQQVFADRLGKSKSWVDKVERGVRRLDKLSALQEIADVLRIDLQLLLGGEPSAVQTGPTADDVDGVRRALARHHAAYWTSRSGVAPSLGELGKAVTHAWLTYQYARYNALLRGLPRLLDDARRTQAEQTGSGATDLLTQVYQVTSHTLRKVGEHDLAWLAADRGLAVSAGVGSPLLTAATVVPLAHALIALGLARDAMEMSIVAAHRLAPPQPLDAGPEQLSVYGTLLLAAATAAARIDDEPGARELIGQAAEAADLVEAGRNHCWTNFGPVAVSLVQAEIEVELGECAAALTVHEAVSAEPDYRRLPAGRRADHLLTVARGRVQAGDPVGAGQDLVAAEGIAPAEVRARPLARDTMATVVRMGGLSLTPSVVKLADAMGIAP